MRSHLMFELNGTVSSLPAKTDPGSDVVKTQDHMKLQHSSWVVTAPPLCSTPPTTFYQYCSRH
eukprot:6440651-Ditylum_brightwellii.AAC.1